jgi:hypothetical protein
MAGPGFKACVHCGKIFRFRNPRQTLCSDICKYKRYRQNNPEQARESGKWSQCGNRHGEYCMARFGDQGAYEIGNVRICSFEENCAERSTNSSATVTGRRMVLRNGRRRWTHPGDEDYPE